MPHALPRPRRRLGWWLVALMMVASLSPAPTAAGDDHLERRKQRVERKVDEAHEHLDQSTARLQRATRALAAAKARLDSARDAHRLAHGRRVAAALVDDRAQAELDAAELSLARAEVRVEDAAARITSQEDQLRTIAVDAFNSGDATLLSLSMVLTTDEPAELMGRLGSMRNIVDREAAALSRLEAARVVHEVERARLEETRDLVEERRERAAETLRGRRAAEEAALATRSRVQELAAEARAHKRVAAKARAADARQLRRIERERDRVQELLRRHYAAARRRAARQAARNRGQDPVRAGGMLWPAQGWVSSEYGMRLHPVYKRWRLHDGLDIAAYCGRPVRAAAPGLVVARYYNGAYGNRVIIAHGLRGGVGTATTYNHLSRFSTYDGQRVRRGEVIGFVGSTGYSTGCHLHFMVMRNGRPVNPRPWLR